MNKLSRLIGTYYKKLSLVGIAALLGLAGVIPAMLFSSSPVFAGQVQSRSITMSSSTPSATSVTYAVTFTPQTSETHPDVIINFCSNDPLINDSCTATAGTDVPNFTGAAAAGWTVTSIASNTSVKLTTTTVSFTASTPVTITLTGVTNPSATGSFYGRIVDYVNGGASTYVSPANVGSFVDYGGIALSTVQNLTVQAKVFETLTFCVYNGTCGTAANLALGAPSTGALSTGTAYVNSGASYNIATNAFHGVSVTMTGQTLCNQATLNFTNCPTGASPNTITAIGGTATTSTVGTSQFGMCAYNGGNANINVASTYNDTTGTHCNGITTGSYAGSSLFGFDDTNSTGTNSAGGSQVMSSSGALNSTTGNFTFLGNITSTTTAGIYNSNLNLVATSTF